MKRMMLKISTVFISFLLLTSLIAFSPSEAAITDLTIFPDGRYFQIQYNGGLYAKTFIEGVSHFGLIGLAWNDLGKAEDDIDVIANAGYNYIRVCLDWCPEEFLGLNWAVVSNLSPPWVWTAKMNALKNIIDYANSQNVIIELYMQRSTDDPTCSPPSTMAGFGLLDDMWVLITDELIGKVNVVFDLSNEDNITTDPLLTNNFLSTLVNHIKRHDSTRLVTQSHTGDIPTREKLEAYIDAGLDFLTIHRPRYWDTWEDTFAKTSTYLEWSQYNKLPIVYNEPFRYANDWLTFYPSIYGYYRDHRCAEARRTVGTELNVGAAGWVFHNLHMCNGAPYNPDPTLDACGVDPDWSDWPGFFQALFEEPTILYAHEKTVFPVLPGLSSICN